MVLGKDPSEIDYIYKESNNVETLNESTEVLKQITLLQSGHYVFGQVIYDTDKFRADEVRTSLAGGYGYKILRTEKFKASNEIWLFKQ